MTEFRAQFPSVYASVGDARRAIVEFAEAWFSADDLTDIQIAAGEALANCAEHGHRDGGTIDVMCRLDGTRLTIDIKDAGVGFSEPLERSAVRPVGAPRGYGTFIMRRLIDRIDYSERGSRILLTKYLKPAATTPASIPKAEREA